MNSAIVAKLGFRSLPIPSPYFRRFSFSAMNPTHRETDHTQQRLVPVHGGFEPLDRFQTPRCAFSGAIRKVSSNLGKYLRHMKLKETVSPPYLASFRSWIHSEVPKEFETNRNTKSMDFVRGIVEKNSKDMWRGPQFTRFGTETNADIVHIKMIRNNSFVTLTDSKGNIKAKTSSGLLKGGRGGAKVSRYAAEATSEHVGRVAKNLGLKSVVMKVNGMTFFKKKKQAILSWGEGFTNSRSDRSPIVYIEDTTRRPHNGCRLRKRRRV